MGHVATEAAFTHELQTLASSSMACGSAQSSSSSHPAMCRAGVTPMRAMLLEFAKQRRRAVLLYSVRAAAEAAFADELRALADASGGAIRFVLTVTGADPAWSGRRGRISAALIREQARGPAECLGKAAAVFASPL